MMTQMNGANYMYANTSWGEYYYLVALNNFKAHGMLNEVFSDALLATLQSRLSFCDMFGADASGTAKFRQATKNATYASDLDLQVHTVLTFSHGTMTRTDTLSSGTLTGNMSVETDFTSFADFPSTTANSVGVSVNYANSSATSYGTTGFDSCALSNFEMAGGVTNPLSTTPIGQLHSNFACTTHPFALAGGSRTLSWTLKYADLN
ncbi:hypothetical protein LMG28614_03424 [Paraburkholderia ultramafica]|uniref:Uncharacterized protein n=1 Tax=Paraburkholderia ultramafica TaxID=1544867 RepID=A0A6S7B8R9_9BURK|nr:hypothetical protein LMG28614_03424 [Paraburkholderia ultramafica]